MVSLMALWGFCLFFDLAASAVNENKIHNDGKEQNSIEEHLHEVAAAYQVREIVFGALDKLRMQTKKSFYYSDDEIGGFQGYDDDSRFRIEKGLLLCVSAQNVPGIIYTRWGVWRFAQNRAAIGSHTTTGKVWDMACSAIFQDNCLALKPYGRAQSLGNRRMYIVKQVNNIKLPDPFDDGEVLQESPSRVTQVLIGLKGRVVEPLSAACSVVAEKIKNVYPKKQKSSYDQVQRYYPPNRYDSLPFTSLLRDNEIYWLQLAQAYKKSINRECQA